MRISLKKIGRYLDCPPKNKALWSYVVSFEFSRPKVAYKKICYSINREEKRKTFQIFCQHFLNNFLKHVGFWGFI